MTIKTFFSCVLFLCATAGYSQNNTTPDNSIEAQFVEVIDKSNNYQKYKVIKRTKLAGLRKNILDSIELLENSIQQKDATIATQNNSILRGGLRPSFCATGWCSPGVYLFHKLLGLLPRSPYIGIHNNPNNPNGL